MTNRIDQTFKKLREKNRKAFVAYVTAFDPNRDTSLEIMRTLADSGVDILELGLPFSDPVADGVINQMAAQRGLESGASVAGALDIVRRFRSTHPEVPVVLFTYLNPVFAFGYDKFQEKALEAGADGVLLVDLTADEAALNPELDRSGGLHHIQLVSPYTPDERKKYIGTRSEGFVYMLSRAGVTGGHSSPNESVGEHVNDMKKFTPLPVVVGFGISTPEMAVEVAAASDGVVIGSAIVKVIAEYGNAPDLHERLRSFVHPLAEAVHGVH